MFIIFGLLNPESSPGVVSEGDRLIGTSRKIVAIPMESVANIDSDRDGSPRPLESLALCPSIEVESALRKLNVLLLMPCKAAWA